MSKPKMRGGFTFTNPFTGSYLIKDINIAVPHQTAVFVTAEQAYKSKDLWRGVSQGRLFPLTGGSGLAVEPIMKPVSDKDTKLEVAAEENRQLRHKLGESNRQKTALHESVQAMSGQLSSILRVLGRIENGEVPMAASNLAAALSAAVPAAVPVAETNEAVGGEIPNFIPDDIRPDGADSNITVKAEVVKGSSVTDSVSTLRKLRGKKPKG
jgi:hypothetical protein